MEFTKDDTKMLKGIAIVLMLCHHLFTFPDRINEELMYISLIPSLGANGTAYYVGWIGKLCVAIFCFLGGYGTYIVCAKKESAEEKQQAIIRKIVGLYKVFWSVFIVFIPLCMIADVPRVSKDIVSFVLNFTALNTTYNGEWWFITSYLILLVLYLFFAKQIEKKRGWLIELSGIAILNIFVLLVIPGIMKCPVFSVLSTSVQWTKIYGAISLLPQFLVGCVVAKYNIFGWIKEKACSNVMYKVASYVVLVVVLILRIKINTEYDYILAPIFCASILTILQDKVWKWFKFILEKLGNESTYIWLIHSFYCYMLCPEIVYYPKVSVLILIWLLLLCYLTAKVIRGVGDLWQKPRKIGQV